LDPAVKLPKILIARMPTVFNYYLSLLGIGQSTENYPAKQTLPRKTLQFHAPGHNGINMPGYGTWAMSEAVMG
jgi:hypothetical protein